MTKMVQEAIEALKDLPEDRQATVARAILDYASHDDDLYHSLTMNAGKCAPVSQRSAAEISPPTRKWRKHISASVYDDRVHATRAIAARGGLRIPVDAQSPGR